MSGLNDSSVNRTDRDFANTHAVHFKEPVIAFDDWNLTDLFDCHWVDSGWPVLVKDEWPQVRMTADRDSVLIVQLSFIPRRSRRHLRHRWKLPDNRRTDVAILAIDFDYVVNSQRATLVLAAEYRNEASAGASQKLQCILGRDLPSLRKSACAHCSTTIAFCRRLAKLPGTRTPNVTNAHTQTPITANSDLRSFALTGVSLGLPASML